MGKYEDLIRLAINDLKVARLILNSANDEFIIYCSNASLNGPCITKVSQ